MQDWHRGGIALLIGALLAALWTQFHHTPHKRLAALARNEGRLVIYSVTDAATARPLIRAFEARYGTWVDYREMSSLALHRRFLADAAAGRPVADVLWSSAMDLQVKLANDGHAASHVPPDAAQLPPWMGYQQQVWITSFEPIVFAYDRRALSPREVPHTRAELTGLLQRQRARFHGRVASYHVERSGVGFNLLSQDVRVGRDETWRLQRALAGVDPRLHTSSSAMLDELASGKAALAYNVIGSYAATRAGRDPRIGFVHPRDYTLVLGRLALIPRNAPHPHAARLWLDFMLSQAGQRLLARAPGTYAVRALEGEARDFDALSELLGNGFEPVFPARGLLIHLDDVKRQALLTRWRALFRVRAD
ncbi:ABC transporter substrate-binding protein [Chitiniphilus shinanonensis]|uniref:ABC transporter substrate-binding protein n=1 Tax=Chitiniphilus shinanonensis TaxID=553088 RepID=UPI0030587113